MESQNNHFFAFTHLCKALKIAFSLLAYLSKAQKTDFLYNTHLGKAIYSFKSSIIINTKN